MMWFAMATQTWITFAIGGVALGYVALRLARRQGGNCCGEKECPAAKEVVRQMNTPS